MNAKTQAALRATIAIWRGNEAVMHPDDAKIGPYESPLCELFRYRPEECKGCVVFAATGKKYCDGTPNAEVEAALDDWEAFAPEEIGYDAGRAQFRLAAQRMRVFLEALQPPSFAARLRAARQIVIAAPAALLFALAAFFIGVAILASLIFNPTQ